MAVAVAADAAVAVAAAAVVGCHPICNTNACLDWGEGVEVAGKLLFVIDLNTLTLRGK